MEKLKQKQRLDEDGQVEQQCIKCLEWWPAGEEFYYPGFATCKACYLEAKYAKRRALANHCPHCGSWEATCDGETIECLSCEFKIAGVSWMDYSQ